MAPTSGGNAGGPTPRAGRDGVKLGRERPEEDVARGEDAADGGDGKRLGLEVELPDHGDRREGELPARLGEDAARLAVPSLRRREDEREVRGDVSGAALGPVDLREELLERVNAALGLEEQPPDLRLRAAPVELADDGREALARDRVAGPLVAEERPPSAGARLGAVLAAAEGDGARPRDQDDARPVGIARGGAREGDARVRRHEDAARPEVLLEGGGQRLDEPGRFHSRESHADALGAPDGDRRPNVAASPAASRIVSTTRGRGRVAAFAGPEAPRPMGTRSSPATTARVRVPPPSTPIQNADMPPA